MSHGEERKLSPDICVALSHAILRLQAIGPYRLYRRVHNLIVPETSISQSHCEEEPCYSAGQHCGALHGRSQGFLVGSSTIRVAESTAT
jgi:hypothetical protein